MISIGMVGSCMTAVGGKEWVVSVGRGLLLPLCLLRLKGASRVVVVVFVVVVALYDLDLVVDAVCCDYQEMNYNVTVVGLEVVVGVSVSLNVNPILAGS